MTVSGRRFRDALTDPFEKCHSARTLIDATRVLEEMQDCQALNERTFLPLLPVSRYQRFTGIGTSNTLD